MKKSFTEKIEAIREEFIDSLPDRINKLQELCNGLYENWGKQSIQLITQELHNLRGISGGHGFIVINETAGKIEALLDKLKNNENLSTDDIKALKDSFQNLISYMHDAHDNIGEQIVAEQYEINRQKAPLILIVDDDIHFCDMLSAQLEHLGYRTRKILELTQLQSSLFTYQPDSVFVDIIFGENKNAGTDFIATLKKKDEVPCPIIYMSARDDLQARVNAVRSGSDAFLCKTFNLADLKTILDVIIPLQQNVKHKVLIVDDDKISAQYCTTILENANIQILTLSKLENIFERIITFDPDLILLDMYMPDINGVEMASVIRQHQNFSTIPIVIMSGETDINKQFKMRSAGADDFILKPFKPRHLVDTVLNRIQRSRQTKHLIFTDGLTGLMLFSKIKDQVVNLLDSCLRYSLDFSIALIDLDHFKNINDTYGHLMGDQILREFSEFLQARIRKSDIVTRSGGEEFTIIFPYTTGNNAKQAVNSFREALSHRSHRANGQEFKISFSAGISSIDQYQDLESLLAAADQALYRAKEKGRNTTKLSD